MKAFKFHGVIVPDRYEFTTRDIKLIEDYLVLHTSEKDEIRKALKKFAMKVIKKEELFTRYRKIKVIVNVNIDGHNEEVMVKFEK